MPLHISMSFNNRLAWETEIDALKTSVASSAPKSRFWLCVICEIYEPKQGDRYTSVLHGVHNCIPPWPLRQGPVENCITFWPVDSTHLFQIGSLDLSPFPYYLQCGKWFLFAFLPFPPSKLKFICRWGIKPELCGSQSCSLLSGVIVNVSNLTPSSQ